MTHWEKGNSKYLYKRNNVEYKLTDRAIYKKRVWELTNKQDLSLLKDINKREFRKYDLDHKISIYYGYVNNIPPENIAHISNLRIIPHKENFIKNKAIYVDMYNKWIVCR